MSSRFSCVTPEIWGVLRTCVEFVIAGCFRVKFYGYIINFTTLHKS